MEKNSSTYYKQVGDYYDFDANVFDFRYWRNTVLQDIRQSFREEVKRHNFRSMLEIGFGTGLDMIHFAQVYPEVEVWGIDISDEMWRITDAKVRQMNLNNVSAAVGSVEDIATLTGGRRFDMIYVFFGALNTVEDLSRAADLLRKSLNPGGTMVLSFVNKWYLLGMKIELLKLRFRAAFSRIRPIWGGYSPNRYLPSRCYTPRQVKEAFSSLELITRRGFCILHPAWYYHRLNNMPRKLRQILWYMDGLLNRTPIWSLGEYTLFVFKSKD